MTSKKIIVGGDFNYSLEKEERSYILRTFISKYDLVDVMGRLYGNQVDFTWENSRGIKSRLDYILIGTKDEVIDGKVMPVFFSDDSAVSARVVVSGPQYGKGYWKMNNEVLSEYDFRESFMKMFAIWVEMKGLYQDRVSWWEGTKRKIKSFIVDYCSRRSRKFKEEFIGLQKEIEEIISIRNIRDEGYEEERLEILKRRQRDFFERRARAVTFKLK